MKNNKVVREVSNSRQIATLALPLSETCGGHGADDELCRKQPTRSSGFVIRKSFIHGFVIHTTPFLFPPSRTPLTPPDKFIGGTGSKEGEPPTRD